MTKPKKVPKFRIAFSMACDNLREEADRDNFLLFLPIARPGDRQWREALRGELEVLYRDTAMSNQWRADIVHSLDSAGRILWGWSTPWRTGKNPLTWEVWDAFCQRWLGAPCALPSRPQGYQLNALCDEVGALEEAEIALVLGNYPMGTKQYEARKGAPAAPNARRGRRSAKNLDEVLQPDLLSADDLELSNREEPIDDGPNDEDD